MLLPNDTLITREKLTNYLLVSKKRNDKSQWLARAGYSFDNYKTLEKDLREQILIQDALLIEQNDYGNVFEIDGVLSGPNGKKLTVCTIWMQEKETSITKFITLYPKKEY
ncbi:MAG TPA: hypothetical protein PLP19_17455 [bacterium]|nr:hypothetical protein [bacterium]HPN45282.1 hypothetical protein [bacterium]